MEFKRPHTLMVQGTTSDAGKSILVTALCRILARNHISVAPFKPQNMALNSAVTAEGGEIGRGQAVQADACYLDASIKMNPILLKPNSDQGSQVIVNGLSIGNMKAKEYHRFKPQLMKQVVSAYESLQQEYQAVIVEGAGSPAEINLREHDIANMGFAETIDCPVIIVADIDRGGVFAHLYGTYALLSPTEQKRIKGFVINRFRGDVTLLDSGLQWLREKTGVPVLAVIPFVKDLHIEAEDSLSQGQFTNLGSNQQLKIVVPTYPRTSNHTDFDILRMHPQVDCQFAKDSSGFSGADLIILPGTKNVRSDLQWLKDSGWQSIIQRHLRLGGKVIGICGGYQMLGQWIHDPYAVESEAGSTRGLELLAMETTLAENKTLRNVTGQLLNTNMHETSAESVAVSGYEIHAGESQGPDLDKPLFSLVNKANVDDVFVDGAQNEQGDVVGTYVHGMFDDPQLLEYWLQWAGLEHSQQFDYAGYKDAQINKLADEVEKVLPLNHLKRLLGMP